MTPREPYPYRLPSRLWSLEEDRRLRELWAGRVMSASQIGAEIGRPRNGVIGRAARLGLPMRVPAIERRQRGPDSTLPPRDPAPDRTRDPTLQRRDKQRRRARAIKYDMVPRPPARRRQYGGYRPPRHVEPWTGESVPFLETGYRQCRAVVSSDTGSDARCCGAPVPYGQPFLFCDYHLSIYTYSSSR
jgi:hypothetical protein